jgi:hypothetical protein
VLTQTGTTVTGTVQVVDSGSGVIGNGRLDGSVLAGGSLQATISMPPGSFPSPFQRCSVNTEATGQLANNNRTMTLAYSGTNSCVGAFTNGTATLQKQ